MDAGAPLAWATRVAGPTAAAIRARWPSAGIDEAARVAWVGDLPEPVGRVLVLTAGTSDRAVAAEVAATLAASGVGCRRVDDVGVAGVHRVLAVADDLAAADAVVVVAGMDGALPSVVAGLTDRLVVAVPTSVGYGAAFEGLAALLAMLTGSSARCGPTARPGVSGSGRGRAAARSSTRSGSRAGRARPRRSRRPRAPGPARPAGR